MMVAGKLDDLCASGSVASSDFSHARKSPEEHVGRVGPLFAAPRDKKVTASELPLRRLFDENRFGFTHVDSLPLALAEPIERARPNLAGGLTKVSFRAVAK